MIGYRPRRRRDVFSLRTLPSLTSQLKCLLNPFHTMSTYMLLVLREKARKLLCLT